MTEEEYFRKNYPDSCYGDKPLSPYWDFFQDGVEFGERESKKRIVDLEKENAELKADNDARKFAMAMSEKVEKQLRNERNTFLAQNEQYEKDLIDFNENLTKAKEIIEGLMRFCRCFAQHHTEDIRYKEAEQFLKYSEVK